MMMMAMGTTTRNDNHAIATDAMLAAQENQHLKNIMEKFTPGNIFDDGSNTFVIVVRFTLTGPSTMRHKRPAKKTKKRNIWMPRRRRNVQKLPKEETVVVCPLNSDGSLGQFEWLQYYTSDIEYMATLAWVGTTESVLYDVSDIARTKRKEYIEQYQSFKLARKLEQEAIAAEKARVELKKRKREAEIKQRLYTKEIFLPASRARLENVKSARLQQQINYILELNDLSILKPKLCEFVLSPNLGGNNEYTLWKYIELFLIGDTKDKLKLFLAKANQTLKGIDYALAWGTFISETDHIWYFDRNNAGELVYKHFVVKDALMNYNVNCGPIPGRCNFSRDPSWPWPAEKVGPSSAKALKFFVHYFHRFFGIRAADTYRSRYQPRVYNPDSAYNDAYREIVATRYCKDFTYYTKHTTFVDKVPPPFPPSLFRAFQSNRNLTQLTITGDFEMPINRLCAALHANQNIQHLILAGAFLNNAAAPAIAKMLESRTFDTLSLCQSFDCLNLSKVADSLLINKKSHNNRDVIKKFFLFGLSYKHTKDKSNCTIPMEMQQKIITKLQQSVTILIVSLTHQKGHPNPRKYGGRGRDPRIMWELQYI